MAKQRSNDPDLHGGRMRVPRSRGALSGGLLLILGIWGLLVPLVGPYVNFGYTPDAAFHFSSGRIWLEVLPGAVAAVGGLLLLVAANRLVTSFGAWMGVAAGAWFVVGPTLERLLHLGSVGIPIHKTTLGSTLETLLLFTGLGALILFLGALAVGRLGVVSVRDVKAAQRREQNDDAQERTRRDDDHTAPTPRPVGNEDTSGADGHRSVHSIRSDDDR